MRLFAAVYPPAAALDHLAAGLPALPAGWRPTPRERWHLTLAFYGEVEPAAVEELTERLGRAVGRTRRPPRCRLAGFGAFGRDVLWVGVAGDRPGLTRLAQRAAAAGRRTGIAVDDRRFRAHLTLARARAGAARAELPAYAGPEWPVTEVVLVRSRLGPHPAHERLAGFGLAYQA